MAHIEMIECEHLLRSGYMNLYGSTGKVYRNRALSVPGYGMVPCSHKLQNSFTTDPEELMLVISDPDDENKPVTSDIWITLRPKDIFVF